MTQRIFTNQVFSNTGIIGAGFKINFFEAGTTTPKDTFSDEALTIANSNPIIADSNGRFTDVFVSNVRLYKSVLTDDNDNALKTLDPIDPDVSSIEDFDPRPLSFWGTTTGTADSYILAADPAITENKNTHIFAIGIHLDCNAGCDLVIDSQTTKNLKKYDGAGAKTDLEAGDLQASQRYFMTDDGVDYIVFNPEKPHIDGANISNIQVSGLLTSVQTFTSSGTWTKPTNINSVRVQLVGGGGGGGAADTGTGGTGGTTSFGSHCLAAGGAGGIGIVGESGAGGAGGIGSNGDLNLTGDGGGGGSVSGSSGGSGQGGGSFYGGGAPSIGGTADVIGSSGFNGGGGGGGYATTNDNGAGGGGGGGYAEKFITSGLGATEIITIGAAGVGASGIRGGGAGGSGLLIVYEYI